MSELDFKGHRILVIGGSDGIGAEFAAYTAERGAAVFVVHRRDESKISKRVKNLEGKILPIRMDATDMARNPEKARDLIERLSAGGELTMVNANAAKSNLAWDTDPQYWEKQKECMTLNYDAVVAISHAYAQRLRATGAPGTLVIPSSVIVPHMSARHGLDPAKEALPIPVNPYTGSKGAMFLFAGAYARSSGAKLGICCPVYGCVDTQGMLWDEGAQVREDVEKAMGGKWTTERVVNEFFSTFNAKTIDGKPANLTAEETARFTAEVAYKTSLDGRFRFPEQPGGPRAMNYDWKAEEAKLDAELMKPAAH